MQINELIYELRLQKELNNIEELIIDNFENESDQSKMLEAVNYILSQEDLDINQKLEAIDNLLTEVVSLSKSPVNATQSTRQAREITARNNANLYSARALNRVPSFPKGKQT